MDRIYQANSYRSKTISRMQTGWVYLRGVATVGTLGFLAAATEDNEARQDTNGQKKAATDPSPE